jgi:Na+-transporting NADH:ubiquinone oxidoreductase subunit E
MHIDPFVLFLAAIFTSNILLTNFLGMCSYLSVSNQINSAFGLGTSVIFVTTFTAVISWLIYYYILVPFHLEYLQLIVFIVVIAAFVQLTEIVMERFTPVLYYTLGIFLPLITVNCAILGVVLFMLIRNYTLVQSFAFGLGGGIGWCLAILLLAGLRSRLKEKLVPVGLRGAGISLIITGIMALAFMGFSGIVNVQ